MKTTKNCLHCSLPFNPTRSDAVYCGIRCRWDAWRERKEQNKESKVMVHPAAIRLLTDATWDFAHNILWGGEAFSLAEEKLAKKYISEYYGEIPAERFTATAHRHFSAYCERVLLAKEYVDRYPHRYIPHPCIWLNKTNPKGFAGTKDWYQRRQDARQLREALQILYREGAFA